MTERLSDAAAWLVPGVVVHKRLRPRAHALSYRVFSLLLDVDRIDEIVRTRRWFSRNRFNVVSVYDRDYGTTQGSINDDVRRVFAEHGFATEDARILLLTYPRLFGFAFNPLSVFYLLGPDGTPRALIYEVNNTFRERMRYVLAAGENQGDGVYAQGCVKELFVSPFAASQGQYGFRVVLNAARALISVNFRDAGGALIKTHFSGRPEPMSDAVLLRHALAMPFMTTKVVAGIHYEAAKLWLKGVPLVHRHRSGRYSIRPLPPTSLLPGNDHGRSYCAERRHAARAAETGAATGRCHPVGGSRGPEASVDRAHPLDAAVRRDRDVWQRCL